MPKNKINISVEDVTLARVDQFAKSNGVSRSGAISVMINQYFMSVEALTSLKTIADEVDRQKQVPCIDEN